jgi:hypothetical protein
MKSVEWIGLKWFLPKWWTAVTWLVVVSCYYGLQDGQAISQDFALWDYNEIEHQYKGNREIIVFPRHNQTTTFYCKVHHHWEDVKSIWSEDRKMFGSQGFRWNYYVSKTKRN